ncbi:3-sulfinopropanoyl-CoA desulfinase [Fodinicurvata sp. EGI_FJ10296]|uniref:3-sulfinopropanoyl-CoA desulfinase n=1 Tax=Fodinicurvata sp. EGI_FJ10296 TaxID=3231908 RepID=UPI003451CC77
MAMLTAEQEALKQRARQVATDRIEPLAASVDQTEEYPWASIDVLKAEGFLGMTIPRAYGGQGLGFLDAVLVIEEMARACATTGRIAVETNMGALSAIMEYGTEDQKRLAAELVLGGDKPAICITEPEAGSAATEMTTRADKRGDSYVLNGHKHWITGAGVSQLHLIFARTFDEDGTELGIGGFIALRDETDGLKVLRRQYAMGVRGLPEGELAIEDVVVPADRVLTSPRGFKRGFGDLMNAYNGQRAGAATVALGIARAAFEKALDYAQEREQFGRPICEFQGLQWMLADMSIEIDAARHMIHDAAARGVPGTDHPFPEPAAAAKAKIFASEMALRVTNNALQVYGAKGYGRDCPMERHVRDARMFTIAGGTAQILRTLVASKLLNRRLPQGR